MQALERADPDALNEIEASELINLYTLLSDVQRGANDLRQEVTDRLPPRLHHDQPVAGQYGSVQRTSRRRTSLKADDEVLETLAQAGIEPERVLGVDRAKVDDALDVTDLSEQAVYDIEESAYVRKAEVDEELKDSRLQGLKDRLAATDGQDARHSKKRSRRWKPGLTISPVSRRGRRSSRAPNRDPSHLDGVSLYKYAISSKATDLWEKPALSPF